MKKLLILLAPIFILVLIFVVMLVACPSKCVEGAPDWPECKDNGEGPPEPTPVKNIVIWNLHDPQDALRGQIQAFESAHREENVRIKYETFTNEAEYERLLISKMAEGKGPDIFAFHYSWLPRHKQKMTPIPESLMIPKEFEETFFDAAYNALVQRDDEGLERIYGLPLYIDSLAIYYNKKYFGVKLPKDIKPGSTWGEIEQQVNNLNESDNSFERFKLSGIAMGRTDNIRFGVDIVNLLLIQYGLNMTDESGKKIIFSEKQGVKAGNGKPDYPARSAFEQFNKFESSQYRLKSWNRLITGQDIINKELATFVKGKTAMIFGYSTTYQELLNLNENLVKSGVNTLAASTKGLEEFIGTVKAPQIVKREDMEVGSAGDYLADFNALTVSVNSQYPELSWELLVALTSQESAKEYHQKTHKPTARRDLLEDQSREPIYGVFAQQIPYAKIIPMYYKFDYYSIIDTAITSLNKRSDEEAIKLAETRIQCMLDKINNKLKTPDQDCTVYGGS